MLHGAFSAIMQDEDGQILEAHSISAGLDYPGTGPEHAWLRDSGRARYVAITDGEALEAFALTARLEGIIPALESAHAIAWALANGPSELDLVCLSGRGDKDLAEALVAARGRGMTGVERIAEAFESRARQRPPRGADAVPDGRLPGPRHARARIGLAYARAGADLSSSASRSPTRSPTAR